MRNNKGFTMIELMITVAILATLTVLTAQSITQAIKAKGKLQDQIDDVSRMRDAMRLVERDINLAYHYRDLEKEMEQILKKKNSTNANGGGNGGTAPSVFPDPNQDPNNRREVPRRDPATHFVGNGESLNLVTMNNARTTRNTAQADFLEVGYSVKDCKNLRNDSASSKCLWRRSTPYVDLDVTKGGDEVVLLENVSEFKLRYMGKGKQDWVTDWRTDAQGDGATKGKFPQAVEVSLTVEKKEKGKSKKYSMQAIVPIHFPNNPEEAANAQGNQSSWPQPSGPTQ
ncbi:general secretion pathway protein GspJ [Bdellovibrio bacteriovorus]|uniref:Type II secretion system protein J n=1 Tax=Bdellovibrio bacteriovorus TaxID=959 RepID=A0A150WBW7_BDEBC|nr:type II secretion system protein GspJ [Bdellovibrio bacteriovorus]KYG60400.1 general secretion pathway protein GspJ [Bdellovibrio bacteriovorus]